MKKLIALFIAVSMILTIVPSVVATADNGVLTANEQSLNRVYGLGLMPHIARDQYAGEAQITRGELAWILQNIYSYIETTNSTDFTWQFYGNSALDNDVLKMPPVDSIPTFQDVNQSHWAFGLIETVAKAGIMNGVSATEFRPDDYITVEQLVKCIVALLGYEAKAQYYGGYPNGYMRVASELDILDGVNAYGVATNDTLVKLLDNSLETRLMSSDSLVGDGNDQYLVSQTTNETFLTGILGLGKAEGTMSDNSITGLLNDSIVETNEFVINNTLLKAESVVANTMYNFIGRDVECYYVKDAKSRKANQVVYAALTGKDTVTTIVPEDFISYSAGQFNYYNGEREDKVKVTDLFALIYNGKARTTYDASIFDIEQGSIKIIKAPKGSMDIVIIEDYETWYVAASDKDKQIIYNRFEGAGLSAICADDYNYITVYKADGTAGAITDIEAGMVIDVAANGDCVTIYINDASEALVIEALENVGGVDKYISGDRSFEVASVYANYDAGIKFKTGDEVTVYLNKFGKIAWAIYGVEETYKVGRILDLENRMEDMKTEAAFLIYDITDKTGVTYYANSKVVVSNSVGVETPYRDMTALVTYIKNLSDYRSIIRYQVNADKKITYIEFPILDGATYPMDKLTLIYDNVNDASIKYRNSNFGAKFIVDSTTQVICHFDPAKMDDMENYEVQTTSQAFENEKDYGESGDGVGKDVKAYVTKRGSKKAEYITYEGASQAAALTYTNSGTNFIVVKNCKNIYDTTEEAVVPSISGMSCKANASAKGAETTLKLRANATVTDLLGNSFNGTIEPGDIVFYGTDEEGYVTKLSVLWDENGVNPASSTGTLGAIAGSTGLNNTAAASGNTPAVLGNPFTLNGANEIKTYSFGAGPVAVFYGSLLNYNYGALELTTQDIQANGYTPGLANYRDSIWTTPTNSIYVTLSGKDNVQAFYGATASIAHLRPYSDYKETCTRVIVMSNYAQISKVIFINGSLER